MKTIEDIFKENLIRLRGPRKVKDLAALAQISPAAYHRVEALGKIPHQDNLTSIAKALGVTEAELFVDHTRYKPAHESDMLDAFTELLRLFPALDQVGRELVLSAARMRFRQLESERNEPGNKRK